MTTRVETDMSEFEDVVNPLVHLYPRRPSYRRSGAAKPQVGDLAYCGHVKAIPFTGKYPTATCAACLRLREASS